MDYNKLASKEAIEKTIAALKEHNVEAFMAETGKEALEKIKEIIPKGASVMNGASRTLEQIGFVEYLKQGKHGWNNLHEKIILERDRVKRVLLRRQATASDYYLGSVHALAQTGEFIVASDTGSQLPHIVFSSPNIILVVSAKKIVPTLVEGMRRLEDYVVALEDQRMMNAHNIHTMLSKIVIFKRENPGGGRKVRMIIVNVDLGF